jgi:hypothetical protein
VFGACVQPVLPIALEHAAEVTYPIPADTSSSVLLVAANLVGMVLTFVLGSTLNLPVSANCTSVLTPTAAVVLAFMVVGALATLPLRHVLVRQHAEAASKAVGGAGAEDGGGAPLLANDSEAPR